MPASSHISTSSKTTAALSKTPTALPPAAAPAGQTPSREPLKHPALKHKPTHKPQPIQNRVSVLLVHIPKFSIQGQARLAAEVGVSRSTISRLVHGRINPSYRLARGVTDALERMLGKPLDMREVFSTDGTYLTASGCALCRCRGCLPEAAWEEDGSRKTEWRDARPGDWSLARPAAPALSDPNSEAVGHESRDQETEAQETEAQETGRVDEERHSDGSSSDGNSSDSEFGEDFGQPGYGEAVDDDFDAEWRKVR